MPQGARLLSIGGPPHRAQGGIDRLRQLCGVHMPLARGAAPRPTQGVGGDRPRPGPKGPSPVAAEGVPVADDGAPGVLDHLHGVDRPAAAPLEVADPDGEARGGPGVELAEGRLRARLAVVLHEDGLDHPGLARRPCEPLAELWGQQFEEGLAEGRGGGQHAGPLARAMPVAQIHHKSIRSRNLHHINEAGARERSYEIVANAPPGAPSRDEEDAPGGGAARPPAG